MAHGGAGGWNDLVEEAAAPLSAKAPLEVAFGMARADTLQDAVTKLEAKGVDRIVVLRLFVSGRSFLKRTLKILGLKKGAGKRPEDWDEHLGHEGHHMHMGGPDAMPLWKVETRSEFYVTREGLLEGGVAEKVLVKRAKKLSTDPKDESVLLLAHGVGIDMIDAFWRRGMIPTAEAVKAALPFRDVAALTMRDDWPEKRKLSTIEIRDFVKKANKDGGRTLVIPYRISGFGPHSDMLDGLEIVKDGRGLLPDPLVTAWFERQLEKALQETGWKL